MAVFQQQTDIVERHQPGKQIDEGDDAQHARHPAHQVDNPITEEGQKRDAGGENQMPALSLTWTNWAIACPDSTAPVALKPRYIRHTSTIGIAAP